MVTTLQKPQSEGSQPQEAPSVAKEALAAVLSRIDEIRGDASAADAILSKADGSLGRAKWASRDTIKPHEASESAARVMSECEAALALAPSKLKEGLRALWTAELAHEQALAATEEAEALAGREEELKPLEAAFGQERAEKLLSKEYELPSGFGSVHLGDNGNYETVFPVGGVVEIIRPDWFVTLQVGLPRRRARIVAVGKLLAALGDRTPENLETTARKLAAPPEGN